MEYLQSARSEKKKGFDLRKRLAIFDLFEGLFSTWYLVAVVGGDTVSLAPVLSIGPQQKSWLCHPLALSMAVGTIPNM